MLTVLRVFILAACSLSLPACHPVPPVVGPSVDGGASSAAINCASDVAASAIADAEGRVATLIATGVTTGNVEAVIIRNLEGLAGDIGPAAFACALQYLASTFKFDADHAKGKVAADKALEAQVARDYLAGHGIKFATVAPN